MTVDGNDGALAARVAIAAKMLSSNLFTDSGARNSSSPIKVIKEIDTLRYQGFYF